jgi:hypothetical protein
MTRADQLDRCKQRALAHIEAGRLTDAVVCFLHGVEASPDLDYDWEVLGVLRRDALRRAERNDAAYLRRWVNGWY